MQFKDVHKGYKVYVLDKCETTIAEKIVIDVSTPHIDSYNLSSNKMVVDVTVENGERPLAYTVTDSSEIAYFNDKVIATDKAFFVNDVEAMKSQSTKHIEDVDYHKQRIEKCDSILMEINPQMKERRETDERLNRLETSVSDMKEILTTINNKLMTKV